MVREKNRARVDDIWQAYRSLSKKDRRVMIDRMLDDDPELLEDMLDIAMVRDRRGQPSRPLEEFAGELRREGRL
jgi:hypothetical protein